MRLTCEITRLLIWWSERRLFRRQRYTEGAVFKFLSAISPCKPTYLNLCSFALITLTSLFTEQNNEECFSCSHLSVGSPAQKLDSSQITDQKGRFHYRTISLLYRTNKLLNLSAIICSPSLRRHREASAVTPILPVCLFCVFKWLSVHTATGANLHLDCSVTAWFSESSTFRNRYSLSGSAWKSIRLPAGSVAPLITLQHYR